MHPSVRRAAHSVASQTTVCVRLLHSSCVRAICLCRTGPVDTQENAANNYPLRGGKYSEFEGGVRAAAFVGGGFIPEAVRGTVNDGTIAIADWYGTLAKLAGVDPTDHTAALWDLPPIDSVDVWPLVSGANGTSPRHELLVDANCLIQGDMKLLRGKVRVNGAFTRACSCDDVSARARVSVIPRCCVRWLVDSTTVWVHSNDQSGSRQPHGHARFCHHCLLVSFGPC